MDTEESFSLVTPALLVPLLRSLLGRATAPVDEKGLREALMRDDKWDAVARESGAVTKALEGMVARREVEVFKGRYRLPGGGK